MSAELSPRSKRERTREPLQLLWARSSVSVAACISASQGTTVDAACVDAVCKRKLRYPSVKDVKTDVKRTRDTEEQRNFSGASDHLIS